MLYKTQNKPKHFYRMDMLKGILSAPMDRQTFLLNVQRDLFKFPHETEDGKMIESFLWNYTGNPCDCHMRIIEKIDVSIPSRFVIYFDDTNRVLDPRNYLKEAMSLSIPEPHYKSDKDRWNRYKYGKAYECAEFRKDPIPGTGNNRKHRYLRHPSGVKKTRGYADDPDYKMFVRKKANPFFNGFYEPWRQYRTHESWKKQKKKHQWE